MPAEVEDRGAGGSDRCSDGSRTASGRCGDGRRCEDGSHTSQWYPRSQVVARGFRHPGARGSVRTRARRVRGGGRRTTRPTLAAARYFIAGSAARAGIGVGDVDELAVVLLGEPAQEVEVDAHVAHRDHVQLDLREAVHVAHPGEDRLGVGDLAAGGGAVGQEVDRVGDRVEVGGERRLLVEADGGPQRAEDVRLVLERGALDRRDGRAPSSRPRRRGTPARGGPSSRRRRG